VENAIHHGVGPRATPGAILIRAQRVGDALHVTVRDDGPGFRVPGGPSGTENHGMGLGLANTRARLKQLYGDAAELRTENGQDGGASVTMVLPFHMIEDPVAALA
jgi:sensor histidine kinase YesM